MRRFPGLEARLAHLRLLSAAASLLLAGHMLQAQAAAADHWYLLLLGGTEVGTVHQQTTGQSDGTLRTEVSQRMTILRYGQPFTVTQEDVWLEHGELEWLRSRLDTNGQAQELEARRGPEGLEVLLTREGRDDRLALPSDGPLLGPALAARELAESLAGLAGLEAGAGARREPLAYLTFSPETQAVVRVELRLLGEGELRDSRGGSHRGWLAEERSSALPGVVTRQVYDTAGRLLYAHTPLGIAVEMILAARLPGDGNRPTAAPAFEVATLGIPVSGLERLQGPPERLQSVTLRFTGTATGGLRRCLESEAWPGAALEPEARAPLGLTVRLWRSVGIGPQEGSADPARDESFVSRFQGDGYYLDLEDPRLARLLAACPGDAARPAGGDAWLACLERAVDRHLEGKSLQWAFAGVAEILTTRAGDCSEHALLLAALLRRSGVPARLAYGFLLTEGGFVGHAWTEAWIGGAWRWLDPSFPGGRPYSLKLPLGTIDPAVPLGTQMGLTLLELAGGLRARLIEARFDPVGPRGAAGPPAAEP